jgi:histidinol-phosphate phosphatase family protein
MRGVIVQWTPHPLPEDAMPHGGIAFIDRDGVLNVGSPNYINTPEELVLLPGAAQAIGDLRRGGYKVCIVTNQSPIMRGLWGVERIHTIHDAMRTMLLELDSDAHFDAVLVCPHRHRDRCTCRKPMPGMLRLGEQLLRGELTPEEKSVIEIHGQAKVSWWSDKIEPSHDYDAMVGDRDSDMGAGWAHGLRCFKVNWNLGLASVKERILDPSDRGDPFNPLR